MRGTNLVPDSRSNSRRWSVIASALLCGGLGVIVMYTKRRAFFSPLAVVVVAAIGLAAVLLQLRYYNREHSAAVQAPVWLNVLGVGFALAARSWWIVGGIILLFFVIYLPVIRSEEVFLRERFPQFDEYSREVPSLFPRLRRFGKRSGSFSWDLYWKHREYNATLGSLAIMAALLVKLLMRW